VKYELGIARILAPTSDERRPLPWGVRPGRMVSQQARGVLSVNLRMPWPDGGVKVVPGWAGGQAAAGRPGLDRKLEREPEAIHMDQDRRGDPGITRQIYREDFRRGALARAVECG
jgi:hypothetical protein